VTSVLENSPQRIGAAISISVIANVGLWYLLSLGSNRVIKFTEPPVLEFSRVTMDERGVKREKVVKPQEVKKKIELVKPVEPRHPTEAPPQPEKQARKAPPPPGAHNKVIVARGPVPSQDPQSGTALADGKAQLGVPTDGQNQGNATTNPPGPTPPSSPANPPVKPEDPPPTVPTQKQVDTTPPPIPKPDPPKPKGPTSEAEPTHQVEVEIPDSIKNQSFKSHVHVKVTVASDGSFDVALRTTSGNQEVDKLVLDCLKKWRWKPAVKDGEPIESVHLFLFEFEVK